MDAVKYLKEYNRMCSKETCTSCPLRDLEKDGFCKDILIKYPEQAVSVIEKWSSEHPMKTRQYELLELFPNVHIVNGYINICPKEVDQTLKDHIDCLKRSCNNCKEEYWLAEVE